MKEVHNQLCI